MSCTPRFLFFTSLLLSVASALYSQDRCSTVKYEELRQIKFPTRETKDQFENWIKTKMAVKPMEAQRTQQTKAIYVIPVVVHIIHNGEPIGTGANISDAQVLSQVNVLNKDFQRLNIDAINTPASFQPVAGSIDIQFVLAKQDPLGAPTNGIVRVQGTQTSWTLNENAIFKALSYWPAEKYMNIWVVKFGDNTVGYAQFPVSNLPGLAGSPDDRLTDGVAIAHTAFGSIDDGAFTLDNRYNKGRTTTHEVGHFLGLRHIWGDDGSSCTGTDYVDDTPNQGGSYQNQCPTTTKTTCTSDDMYMNFMDYTNDACMNLYTVGQLGRVSVVLQNSPRRLSLLTSEGATDPPPVALDGALKKIINPGVTNCGGTIQPVAQIQNIGTSNLTSIQVKFSVNGVAIETKDFIVSLVTGEVSNVQFSPYAVSGTSNQFSFEVTLLNGSADTRAFNNVSSITSKVPPSSTLPISETFDSMPVTWTITNPDNLKTWALHPTTNGNSLFLNSYDYDNQGAIDRISSPVIDLTNVTFAYLKFDRAYEFYSFDFQDKLRVTVSPTCDINQADIIFDKGGSALSTATASTGTYFEPTANEWKTEIISLNQYLGSKIQITFEGINGYGNNQYLDNIVVSTDAFNDLALVSLESPSPVTCNTSITPVVLVKNVGSTTISNFKITTTINNLSPQVHTISNITLLPGEIYNAQLSNMSLLTGTNTISVSISDPNNLIDANTSDNQKVYTRIVNSSNDIIPLRENFEQDFSSWTIVSQGQEKQWTPLGTNKGTSLAYLAYDNPNLGEQSWLVSPVLDLSTPRKASVFFETSYASNFNGNEKLEVLYSTDCGNTFNNVLFTQSGSTLATVSSNAFWTPSANDHWQKNFINLSTLTGYDQVRLAFVATANHGNNLYIDNIEFFMDDNSNPLAINDAYTIYGLGNDLRITFNLPERQPVEVRIYNSIGQLILNNTFAETLNQTYYFDVGPVSTGIYIVKVQTPNSTGAARVYLGQ